MHMNGKLCCSWENPPLPRDCLWVLPSPFLRPTGRSQQTPEKFYRTIQVFLNHLWQMHVSATSVHCADALEQVSSIILLAPGVSNSIGRPCVLIVASISRGASDASTAFSQASTIYHHPALVGLLPGFSNHIGSPSSMIKTFLSYGLAGPFSFSITKTHTL